MSNEMSALWRRRLEGVARGPELNSGKWPRDETPWSRSLHEHILCVFSYDILPQISIPTCPVV